jgi:drug/metabolite transporter (DMT)-like permease
MVGAAAFFGSVAIMVTVLVRSRGPLRWLAIALGLGALLIFAEIITAQVLLSQIGNLLMLVAGVMFAREVIRRDQPSIAT